MLPSYTRETRIITDAYWAEPYMEHIIKGVNMSEYPEKNMGRRSRRSKKGASAHRHHMFSEEDTHEATKAKGLFDTALAAINVEQALRPAWRGIL